MKILLAILIILLLGFQLGQDYVIKMIDNITFQVAPSHEQFAFVGLGYKEITLSNDGRKVKAWFSEASKDKTSGTVVLLFNGVGGSKSDWIYFQKYLSDSGIASVSFNYGPDEDTLSKDKGSSRLSDVTKDVAAIIDTLHSQYGKNLKLFLLGHSVGNAVMLEMYSKLDTSVIKAVIICNAFSSIRNWTVQHHHFPEIFSFMFPDYFDNVDNIREVYKPVIILHSKTDSTNLFSDAKEIFKSANSNKQFIQFDNFSHNDMLRKDNLAYWSPIVKFIKTDSDK